MTYKNVVFTKHALARLDDRTITQDAVYRVIQSPDRRFERDDTTKFIRTLNGRKYHVVASYLKKEHKWLVVSVWVRGEDDKISLAWQLITLPFRLAWWGMRLIYAKTTRNI